MSAAAVYFLPLLVAAAVGNRFLVYMVVGAFPVAVVLGRLASYVVLTPLGVGIHGLSGMTTSSSGGWNIEDRLPRLRATPSTGDAVLG